MSRTLAQAGLVTKRVGIGPFLRYATRVTQTAWLLLSWILVGAVFVLVHLLALVQALRARRIAPGWRLFALFPPVTPVFAWIGGSRVVPILWCAILVAYVALRLLG